MSWPFGDLKPMGYGAILIDPPWRYAMRSAKGYAKSPEAHYDTMSDEDILALPVGDLAQRDCLLMMWAVWPKLPLAVECVSRWGFRFGQWCSYSFVLSLDYSFDAGPDALFPCPLPSDHRY